MPCCWGFRWGEDAVGVDEDAAAADPGQATRISGPLRKGRNLWTGAGEGLPLCLGSFATLKELPLVSADGTEYPSTTDVYRDRKAIAEDGARRGIDVGGCLHGHDLERCDVDGCFGLRGDAFYGRQDQMNVVLDLYREGVAPGNPGPQMAVILGFVDAG